jgi:hypothetical protein
VPRASPAAPLLRPCLRSPPFLQGGGKSRNNG